MKYRLEICRFIFCLMILTNLQAQDVHFSQFHVSPTFVNPAATGLLSKDYRGSVVYKSQWQSVSTPYRTMGISADGTIPSRADYVMRKIGLGFGVVSDKAGSSSYKKDNYFVSVSSIQEMFGGATGSIGLQVGMGRQSFDLNGLTWDNQYQGGAYSSSLGSNELITNTQKAYLDVGAGFMLQKELQGKSRIDVGVSAFHLNRPNTAFGNDKDILPMKFSGQMSLIYHMVGYEKERYFEPRVFYSRQNGHQEIVAGVSVFSVMQSSSRYTSFQEETKAGAGIYYRHNDAVMLLLNYEYNSMQFGLSYDFNISKLSAVSQYRGGMELTFSYSGLYNSQTRRMYKSSNKTD